MNAKLCRPNTYEYTCLTPLSLSTPQYHLFNSTATIHHIACIQTNMGCCCPHFVPRSHALIMDNTTLVPRHSSPLASPSPPTCPTCAYNACTTQPPNPSLSCPITNKSACAVVPPRLSPLALCHLPRHHPHSSHPCI